MSGCAERMKKIWRNILIDFSTTIFVKEDTFQSRPNLPPILKNLAVIFVYKKKYIFLHT